MESYTLASTTQFLRVLFHGVLSRLILFQVCGDGGSRGEIMTEAFPVPLCQLCASRTMETWFLFPSQAARSHIPPLWWFLVTAVEVKSGSKLSEPTSSDVLHPVTLHTLMSLEHPKWHHKVYQLFRCLCPWRTFLSQTTEHFKEANDYQNHTQTHGN